MSEIPAILGLLLVFLLFMTIIMPVAVFFIWVTVSKINTTLIKMEHMMRHGK